MKARVFSSPLLLFLKAFASLRVFTVTLKRIGDCAIPDDISDINVRLDILNKLQQIPNVECPSDGLDDLIANLLEKIERNVRENR